MPIQVHSFLIQENQPVPIQRFQGPIRDERYIEGSMQVLVDGDEIVPPGLVDLIDKLWVQLAQGLTEAAQGRRWATRLPDQPATLELQPKATGHIQIAFTSQGRVRGALADREELLTAMAQAGAAFFQALEPHVEDADRYAKAREALGALLEEPAAEA